MSQIVPWIAVLFAFHALARLYRGGVCVQCRGRGKHRDGCPFKR